MFDTLISQIQAAVYTNTSQAITGNSLQTLLVSMANELGGSSGFMGIAQSGSGTEVAATDKKQWYIAVNTTSLTVSYPRFIAGDTAQLQPGGIAIIYCLGSGWQWANLTGTTTNASSILGQIQAIVTQIGDASTPTSILGQIDELSDGVTSASDNAMLERVQRLGIRFAIRAEERTTIPFTAGSLIGSVTNGVYTEGINVVLQSGDNDIFILPKDWENPDTSIFTPTIADCTKMEIPQTVRTMPDIGINVADNPSTQIWFHGATPPNLASTTQLDAFTTIYTHKVFQAQYEGVFRHVTVDAITY